MSTETIKIGEWACGPFSVPEVQVRLLRDNARAPERATEGAAGWDVRAYAAPDLLPEDMRRMCEVVEKRGRQFVRLPRDCVAVVPLGFALALPSGWEAQVRPRSGLSVRHSLVLVPTIGTVDSDFRGCVAASYLNLGPEDVYVAHGDRVAQIVFSKLPDVSVRVVQSLPESERGEGGWGHTGVG